MSKTVRPDELATAILSELKNYDQAVTDGVKKRFGRWQRNAAKTL